MEIESIKVISMEMIKPSSPTPKSLQKYLLSSIDQAIPPIVCPCLYFYASDSNIPTSHDLSKRLKKSLSEVLSTFYPLAGTLVGNHYVDCNDSGAHFFEAEANCDLSPVVRSRNLQDMEKLLPYDVDDRRDYCLAVKATYFRCGGVALGLILPHKVIDAMSAFLFANAWAAATAARSDGAKLPFPLPKFDGAAYNPPLQDTSGIPVSGVVKKEELASRVFTFPAAAISLLRERYSGSGGDRPSRVEAVSAFIWTQFASATGARSDPSKTYVVGHAINLRSRVDPPLSEYCFGNVVGLSTAVVAGEDGGAEVVRKIREAVKGVSEAFAGSADMDESELVFVNFSSLCGIPLYGADFGWGRPVWVGLPRYTLKNLVFLVDEPSGGGMEAFMYLTKPEMVKFESHFQLPLLSSNL